jgi:prepilin-type processing-associated H-X9-DG protein
VARIFDTVFERLEMELRAADEPRLRELEDHYRALAGQGGAKAELWYALGGIALSRGELAAAEEMLRRAAGRDPGQPAILAALGETLFRRGRLVEAEAVLHAAAGLRPTDHWTLFWLGRTQAGMGRPGAAETALRRAVALAPNTPGLHAELGHVLARRGDTAEARACFERALKLNPDTGTRLTVLDYLARLGDMDAVVEAYRDLLDAQPGNVRAWYNLALKAPGALRDDERRELERIAESAESSDAAHAAVQYALAGVTERAGDTDATIAHASAANAAMLDCHVASGVSYEPDTHHRQIARIIEMFDGNWFARTAGWGDESILPVFIVGMPRSGTSLVEQILASHPQVFGGGELVVVNLSLERLPLLMQRDGDFMACLEHVSRKEISGSARFCLDSFKELAAGAPRVTDKFPDNYLHLGWIRTLFPKAPIVHCERDSRDTAISCWLNRLPELAWVCDLEHITARIEDYRRLMEHWRDVLPGGFLDLSYEALVTDPERQGQRLVEHCGLDWDPVCLRFHETPRVVETASYRQVRKPVYGSSAGRWQSFRSVLEPWLERLTV